MIQKKRKTIAEVSFVFLFSFFFFNFLLNLMLYVCYDMIEYQSSGIEI